MVPAISLNTPLILPCSEPTAKAPLWFFRPPSEAEALAESKVLLWHRPIVCFLSEIICIYIYIYLINDQTSFQGLLGGISGEFRDNNKNDKNIKRRSKTDLLRCLLFVSWFPTNQQQSSRSLDRSSSFPKSPLGSEDPKSSSAELACIRMTRLWHVIRALMNHFALCPFA